MEGWHSSCLSESDAAGPACCRSCMLQPSLAAAGCGQEMLSKLEEFWVSSYRKQKCQDLSQHREDRGKQEEVEVIS